MPDRTPEHDEHPPQWPPPSWHVEPTVDPQPPAEGHAATNGNGTGVAGRSSAAGETMTDVPAREPAPPDRALVHVPQTDSKPQGPPTHGRGVRMTIYGFGGACVVALIAVIVVMASATLGPQANDTEGNKLLDSSGEVDPAAYKDLASAAGTAKWIDWRYGKAGGGSDGPSATTPKTKPLKTSDGIEHVYQHGDGSSATNAANVQGQLGYVSEKAAAPGVDHVTAVETTASSAGFTPRPGGRFSADMQDPDVSGKTMKSCAGSGGPGRLVSMDRAHGKGWAAQSVLAFSSGVVSTAGVSGAQGAACLKLPQGQVPTGVTVTPGNEFALVSVWDTKKVRGRVAVIAMGDTPQTYLSSWPRTYPGLPNPGHFSFAKLLGFVNLKEVKAPTAIAAGTDYPGDSQVDRSTANLASAKSRAAHSKFAASTGYAVVSSGAEKKLEWLDLTPLLSGFAKTYFEGNPEGFAKPGNGAKQWPQTFEVNSKYAPTPTGTQELDHAPTALASIGQTAYVADQSGKVTAFEANDAGNVSPGATLSLGGAATCVTVTADGQQLLATSREDRSVTWVSPGESKLKTSQVLQDKRITDPICTVDNTTSQTDATRIKTVSIADYSGGDLDTFRYGAGGLADGTDLSLQKEAFEYGGSYEPKGQPFAVSTTRDVG